MLGELLYVGDLRQKEHLLSTSITVDTADEFKQLFLEFGAAGVVFHQKSERELGARGTSYPGLDRSLILFARPD